MSTPTLLSGKAPPFISRSQSLVLAGFFGLQGLIGMLWIWFDPRGSDLALLYGLVYGLTSGFTAWNLARGAGSGLVLGLVRLFVEWILLLPDSQKKASLSYHALHVLDVVAVLLVGLWAAVMVVKGLRGPWGLSRAYWPSAWRQFRKNRLALVGFAFAASLGAIALFADFLASDQPILMSRQGELHVLPNMFKDTDLLREDIFSLSKDPKVAWKIDPLIPYGPLQDRVEGQLSVEQPPSGAHWFGTDNRGRDVLSRLIHGARISLSVGFVAVSIYVFIGLLLGSLAGYFGGWIDSIISRITEVLLSFPSLILILALMGIVEEPSIYIVMLVIGLTGWTGVSRLVRAEILKLKAMDFITAARALGMPSRRIITVHLLPNAMGPVLVAATFGIASAILVEASLSFLGFGVQPPTPSWGEVLLQARQNLQSWWLSIFPGFAIFLSVTSYNLVGEGLRDAIDPKLKKE